MKKIKATELDKIFDAGEEDVLDYFDASRAYKPNAVPKRVNIDFPPWMVSAVDREAARVGVTRQALLKMWTDERLREIRA